MKKRCKHNFVFVCFVEIPTDRWIIGGELPIQEVRHAQVFKCADCPKLTIKEFLI